MKKGDMIFSIICMGLSLWLILESQKFDYAIQIRDRTRFFPLLAGDHSRD